MCITYSNLHLSDWRGATAYRNDFTKTRYECICYLKLPIPQEWFDIPLISLIRAHFRPWQETFSFRLRVSILEPERISHRGSMETFYAWRVFWKKERLHLSKDVVTRISKDDLCRVISSDGPYTSYQNSADLTSYNMGEVPNRCHEAFHKRFFLRYFRFQSYHAFGDIFFSKL